MQNTSVIDKIAEGLRKTAVELEEFQLQLALGKAEAADQYESIKKKLNTFLQKIDAKIGHEVPDTSALRGKLDELRVQLVLGQAESREVFTEQKKRILKAIDDLEKSLNNSGIAARLKLRIKSELRVFRIKLEILRLRFELGKLKMKKVVKTRRDEFIKKTQQLRTRLIRKNSELEKNWEHFSDEMDKAYSHLKKAFAG